MSYPMAADNRPPQLASLSQHVNSTTPEREAAGASEVQRAVYNSNPKSYSRQCKSKKRLFKHISLARLMRRVAGKGSTTKPRESCSCHGGSDMESFKHTPVQLKDTACGKIKHPFTQTATSGTMNKTEQQRDAVPTRPSPLPGTAMYGRLQAAVRNNLLQLGLPLKNSEDFVQSRGAQQSGADSPELSYTSTLTSDIDQATLLIAADGNINADKVTNPPRLHKDDRRLPPLSPHRFLVPRLIRLPNHMEIPKRNWLVGGPVEYNDGISEMTSLASVSSSFDSLDDLFPNGAFLDAPLHLVDESEYPASVDKSGPRSRSKSEHTASSIGWDSMEARLHFGSSSSQVRSG